MRTLFITLSAISILASCSTKEVKQEKPAIIFENNTELDEWASTQTIKQVPNAHSGKFVSVVDSINPYSLGISKSIKDISTQPMDSVVFSYWVFLKNVNTDAKTVCDITDKEGKRLQWDGALLRDKIKEVNKWIEIKETFKIPATVNLESYMKLYVWNTSKDELLIDDLKVVFK
jgi:hypothetical protein